MTQAGLSAIDYVVIAVYVAGVDPESVVVSALLEEVRQMLITIYGGNKSPEDFEIGTIEIDSTGKHQLSLTADSIARDYLMFLKSITLVPSK